MRYFRDTSGSIAVYAAVFGVLAIGAGGLAVDFGRASVLRTQMQDRADAGAMAAAVQLDGRDGAQDRARFVAMQAMAQHSGFAANGADLTVQAVNFYETYDPLDPADGDGDSKFVEVVLAPKQMNLFLMPILRRMTGGAGSNSINLEASAVATADPFICHAPPLMICDFAEQDPNDDLRLPANAGRMVVLKPPPSSGTWGPGNFGLLATADGDNTADAIEGALAAVEPPSCYDIEVGVETATGSKTNKVVDGINARFDLPSNSWPYPAPNVINYPRDDMIIADPNANLGDGVWDLDGYWMAKHGVATPADLAGASRYQTYLYELGLEYARNGRQTLYPAPSTLPPGYDLITPPAPDIPEDAANPDDPNFDGVPSEAVASNGQARRLVQVAQLQCIADNVHGSNSYPTDGNYVEVFLTEYAPSPPNMALYGEVLRGLNAANDPEFHANVSLVE